MWRSHLVDWIMLGSPWIILDRGGLFWIILDHVSPGSRSRTSTEAVLVCWWLYRGGWGSETSLDKEAAARQDTAALLCSPAIGPTVVAVVLVDQWTYLNLAMLSPRSQKMLLLQCFCSASSPRCIAVTLFSKKKHALWAVLSLSGKMRMRMRKDDILKQQQTYKVFYGCFRQKSQ